MPYVVEALNSLRTGEKKLNDLIAFNKGQISIGIPSHIGVFFLTGIIKQFNNKYPHIKIKVICKPTKELFHLLRVKDIDILIDCSPFEMNMKELVLKKITSERCAFACNVKNTELLNKKVTLDELLNYPLIVPLTTSSSTKSLASVFEKKHICFQPMFEIATSDMIAAMVEQNIGIGFLFEKTIEKYCNLQKIDTDCLLPKFDIFLIYRDALLSISAQEFIKFMNKYFV